MKATTTYNGKEFEVSLTDAQVEEVKRKAEFNWRRIRYRRFEFFITKSKTNRFGIYAPRWNYWSICFFKFFIHFSIAPF